MRYTDFGLEIHDIRGIDISISDHRNLDFQVGIDLMDQLQIFVRSRFFGRILKFSIFGRNHEILYKDGMCHFP